MYLYPNPCRFTYRLRGLVVMTSRLQNDETREDREFNPRRGYIFCEIYFSREFKPCRVY
jgi:hypothetical protein